MNKNEMIEEIRRIEMNEFGRVFTNKTWERESKAHIEEKYNSAKKVEEEKSNN